MNTNVNLGISLVTGGCATVTVMNALNGALNCATGKPGDEKQKNLIFSIGMIAISAVVGAVVGKRTSAFLDGCDRVRGAVVDKISNDICDVRYETAEPEKSDVMHEDTTTDAYTEFMKEMDSYDGTL